MSAYHILVLPNRRSGVEGVVTRRFTIDVASRHPDHPSSKDISIRTPTAFVPVVLDQFT